MFILWLIYTDGAYAHVAGNGTSDEPSEADPGENIQVYKIPGTNFNGAFRDARREWNHVSQQVKFGMVRDPGRAELTVFAHDFGCNGSIAPNGETGIGWHWDYGPQALMWVDLGCKGSKRKAVILHELGHALDLEHHPCTDLSSVMNMCARVNLITNHDRIAASSILLESH
jgi:hypothetical protein